MRKTGILWVLTLHLIISVTHVVAQNNNVWTLQKCIEYAREHNITVKKVQLNMESARLNVTQSWAAVAPTLNGFFTETFNYGLRFDPTTSLLNNQHFTTTSIGANSQFIVFNGLANYYTISQNKNTYKASQYDFQQALDDISLNIANLYMQVLFAQERLEIVKQQVELLKKQVDRSKQLYQAGALTQGALLSIEAQLATQELTLINGENALANAKLALIQALALDEFDIQIEKPDFSKIQVDEFNETKNAQSIYTMAVNSRPNILSREYRLKSARYALAVARGNYYPQFSVNTSISTIFSGLLKQNPFDPNSPVVPFFEQLKRNNSQQIALGLTFPIFSGLQIRTAVQQAKLQYKNAELDLLAEQLNLKNTIQQAYADVRTAAKTYQANKKNLQALEENYNYAKQRFDTNLINSVEFNDAATRYFNARTELLIAQYDFIFKSKVLDFYKGKKIEF